MPRIRKISIILSSIFILVGCAVGPNFKKPEYKANEQFRTITATDTSLNMQWWNFYNDPILDTLIVKALNNNKNLLMAAARIQQAKANLGMVRSDQFPKFNINAGILGGNYFGGNYLGNTNQFNWGVTPELNWELDFWGKFRRASEAARANLVSSIYGHRSIQMSLIADIAKNYFLLLDYKRRLVIAKNTYEARDSSELIIQARYDRGYAPEIDLNQAQIQTAISQSQIPVYERSIATLENNISVLLGENPHEIVTNGDLFDFPIPDTIPSAVPSLLLKRRPDILAAEADLHEQVARVGVAQAMRFPSFTIGGGIGIASNFSLIGLGWNVGATLFGPLFQFNKNKRRMEVEKFKADEVAFKYEQTVLQAFEEVENNLITIQKLKEELEARSKHMTAAQNAEKLSLERYNKGVTSYLEVLESQKQSFDAQLQYTRIYQELLSYYILLYKSLGGGWITPEELKEAQDKNILYKEYIIPYHDLPAKERRKAEKEAKKKAKAEKKSSKK
ncbi:MAG: efflux transporter outer membrane subunit [Crocinitomicaceae bacterium]|nr:efflux transporter outer membrane subunit [Crocinitomicaceae bacterium]